MKAMDAGKEVPKNQRKIIFDAFGSLIDLVTGDTTVFQKAKKAVKEEVEKDPNEYDNEGEMVKDHLDIVMDAADEMYDMVEDNENMPEWVQAKITKAADYLDSSRDYLMSQDRDDPADATNEETVKEATDVYDKGGIQITRTALKGGLGFQINYGERGRYIQVLKKDMNNLMKAMQTAMKAK